MVEPPEVRARTDVCVAARQNVQSGGQNGSHFAMSAAGPTDRVGDVRTARGG